MKFTIVTGLSGAGRSLALKALEDIGFFCVDNIPPQLIPGFAEIVMARIDPPENVACAVDMRMGEMFETIYDTIDTLNNMELELNILFLEASDEVLVSRFNQTRRKHPVSGSGRILSGILMEREKLERIKQMADIVLDTSTYSVRQLSDMIARRFSEEKRGLMIGIITFGYKRGIPMDADLVFDMRFLPNPYYMASLRTKTGLSAEVRDFVLSSAAAKDLLIMLESMLKKLAPMYLEQDKKQLTVAIGCTGGMHRSVAMGEELYQMLKLADVNVTIEHRDIYLEKNSVDKKFLKAHPIDD